MSREYKQVVMNVKISGIAKVIQEANSLGKDIIHLEVGDVDFDPPESMLNYIKEAFEMKKTHYPPADGNEELIRKLIEIEDLPEIGKNNIYITPGGSMGVYLALQTKINHGDVVILFEPCWPHLVEMVKLAGGIPKLIPLSPENNYHISDEIIRNIEPENAKAILINTPNNPTGTVYTIEDMQLIVDFAKKHQLSIICDEEYRLFCYNSIKMCNLYRLYDNCIIVRSFSKSLSITGLRLGYVIGPVEWISQIKKWGLYSVMYPSSIIQHAVYKILNEVNSFQQNMVSRFQKRIDKVFPILKSCKYIKCSYPEGSVYLWIDCNDVSSDDYMITRRLLYNAGVAVVPGSCFGDSAKGFLRISLGAKDELLQTAILKIVDEINKMGGR